MLDLPSPHEIDKEFERFVYGDIDSSRGYEKNAYEDNRTIFLETVGGTSREIEADIGSVLSFAKERFSSLDTKTKKHFFGYLLDIPYVSDKQSLTDLLITLFHVDGTTDALAVDITSRVHKSLSQD